MKCIAKYFFGCVKRFDNFISAIEVLSLSGNFLLHLRQSKSFSHSPSMQKKESITTNMAFDK